ncbi:TLR4 interactor with leucine rich repeat [Fasciola hepatica]|uniref:TLR4 interactor with leucine rich repeat n=1 Tax=Fasciola hepatica TaxID=6192 RepID=A0A2H1CTU7_FASHE|nr:TLR4 interactor with leucine rich repeat [Fasciola hepatica]
MEITPTVVLSLFIFLVCVLLHSTSAIQETPGLEENSCRCDFADITGTCVCADVDNVSSLDDLFDTYSDLLCSVQSSLIRSAQFVRLPQLRTVVGNQSLLRSNCSLKYLTNMSLSSTGLVQLDENSFWDFPNLVWLNFSHNQQLNNYGDGAFAPFGAQLITLIAQHNPVRSLTRDVFRGLHVLQKLFLSDNKIGYIEAGVFSRNCCADLRELRLDNNILTVLDSDTFSGLKRLEVLDLRNNPLQQIDPGTFVHAATTLTELYMSHNDATSFGGFDSPHPDLFVQLNRLTVLQMDQLKLKNLSSVNFRGLSNLRILSLRGNRLTQLPADVFSVLKGLEHLDLSANLLVCVPSALNPVEQSDFLAGLPLKWIDLSWNRLTHLNQLTIRSLGLFEPRPLDGTRVVLNLTANPWQNIDDDAFCGLPATPVIQPTDLIMGPAPSTPFGAWRTSLGLWVSRAQWPNGPLALIGPKSRLFGLMLNDATTERLIELPDDEFGFFRFGHALLGSDSSEHSCQQLRVNERPRRAPNDTSQLGEIRRPSPISIAYSLASYCPRLLIHKLEDWELDNLRVSELVDSYDSMGKSSLLTTDRGSRLYLLVIVGVCITFLLIALTVIMCYRAWSRRTSQKCGNNDFAGCPTGLTLEGPTEKQLLLRHQTISVNNVNSNPINTNTHADDNGNEEDRQYHRHSHSFHTSHSNPVDGHRSAGFQTTTTTTTAVESNDSGPVLADSRSISPNLIDSQAAVCAIMPISRAHLRSGRPKSDSDANEIDTSQKLTAFGVV